MPLIREQSAGIVEGLSLRKIYVITTIRKDGLLTGLLNASGFLSSAATNVATTGPRLPSTRSRVSLNAVRPDRSNQLGPHRDDGVFLFTRSFGVRTLCVTSFANFRFVP